MAIHKKDFRWLILSVSLLVFGSALALPAARLFGIFIVDGYKLLLWGYLGAFSYDFPWFANIVYLAALACLSMRWYAAARNMSLAALGLAALTLRTQFFGYTMGNLLTVIELGPAFYLWFLSFLIVGLGASCLHSIDRPTARVTPSTQSDDF